MDWKAPVCRLGTSGSWRSGGVLGGPGPGFEDLDDHEATLAAERAGADVAAGEALHHGFQALVVPGLGFGLAKDLTAGGELLAAVAVGEEAVVAAPAKGGLA